MGEERYRRGANTVTEFKYHFVLKTKYSYGVLKGETGKFYRQGAKLNWPTYLDLD